MISVFATLNENPFIRYYFPSKQADSSNKTTYAARLAQAVQTELDAYCALNPTFPVHFLLLCSCFVAVSVAEDYYIDSCRSSKTKGHHVYIG